MTEVRRRRTQAERSAGTRAVLLDAAIRVLREHGYGATTTLLVAAEAGVSRGAMLHQFRTKADLMTFVVEAVYEEELARYAEHFRGMTNPREIIRAYPEVGWKVLSRPSGVAVLEILQGSRSDHVLAEKLAPLQARIEEDALRRIRETIGVVDSSMAMMRLIVWAVRGLSIASVLAPRPEEIVASIRLLSRLIDAGFENGALQLDHPRAGAGATDTARAKQ
ncbi:TetR/AcrR family transcriptional regulator [Sphingomonas sp. CL5.1]|uniref:TetR/AcrR family transcriptional regulator n=1 Tax=Sphingomonas sp. CL5.1 TaxID=2653203 RepID=UPI0015837E18|nr:TetR/AcrR family transcriptional regulator [Sphingomonas sp. CL5.1]QKR98534.1 TetR/AcrR family transcriptional regulator [Sphingomonas sp. CL5.1]